VCGTGVVWDAVDRWDRRPPPTGLKCWRQSSAGGASRRGRAAGVEAAACSRFGRRPPPAPCTAPPPPPPPPPHGSHRRTRSCSQPATGRARCAATGSAQSSRRHTTARYSQNQERVACRHRCHRRRSSGKALEGLRQCMGVGHPLPRGGTEGRVGASVCTAAAAATACRVAAGVARVAQDDVPQGGWAGRGVTLETSRRGRAAACHGQCSDVPCVGAGDMDALRHGDGRGWAIIVGGAGYQRLRFHASAVGVRWQFH